MVRRMHRSRRCGSPLRRHKFLALTQTGSSRSSAPAASAWSTFLYPAPIRLRPPTSCRRFHSRCDRRPRRATSGLVCRDGTRTRARRPHCRAEKKGESHDEPRRELGGRGTTGTGARSGRDGTATQSEGVQNGRGRVGLDPVRSLSPISCTRPAHSLGRRTLT